MLVARGEIGTDVEEVGDKGEVETGVPDNEGRGVRYLRQSIGGCVLEDLFGALAEISGLKGSTGAFIGFELVEEDVVFAIAYVATKVVYSEADDGQDERSGMQE